MSSTLQCAKRKNHESCIGSALNGHINYNEDPYVSSTLRCGKHRLHESSSVQPAIILGVHSPHTALTQLVHVFHDFFVSHADPSLSWRHVTLTPRKMIYASDVGSCTLKHKFDEQAFRQLWMTFWTMYNISDGLVNKCFGSKNPISPRPLTQTNLIHSVMRHPLRARNIVMHDAARRRHGNNCNSNGHSVGTGTS